MINIYIETNFILELAFAQEKFESCEKIVELCEDENCNLIIPAFSIAECYEAFVRRTKNRKRVKEEFEKVKRELSRSIEYRDEVVAYQGFSGLIVRSIQEEDERLTNVLQRILSIAEIIPLEATTVLEAVNYRARHDFSYQDSIVYTSIIHHLQKVTTMTNCFLNKNSKDFDDPDIVQSLEIYNCKMLSCFDDGLRYIQSCLRSP